MKKLPKIYSVTPISALAITSDFFYVFYTNCSEISIDHAIDSPPNNINKQIFLSHNGF